MKVKVIVLKLLFIFSMNILFALNRVDITDVVLKMSGREEKLFEYKFSKGDTIVLNAGVDKGNNISVIEVVEWPSSARFQAFDVTELVDKKIVVAKTNVFIFRLKNQALMKSQTYSLKIQRAPSSQESIDFNTSVSWDTTFDTAYVANIETTLVKIDTIPEEIINTQKKLGSQLSGNTRSYIEVDLPENISSWAYWIGVGQEAADGLQAMASALPEAATGLFAANPVAAFAVGLIPSLFSMNKGMDVNYYFIADYKNIADFMNEQEFYQFKGGIKVITDYAKMDPQGTNNFYLALDNSYSAVTSKIVSVHVVAIKIVPQFVYKEVMKPVINSKITPHLND